MKKILLVASVFFISIAALGQNGTKEKKDSLMKALTADLCAEIGKNKDDLKGENFEMSLGLIMMGAISDKATELQSVFNLDFSNNESMSEFSEEVGMKLAIECPDFLRLVAEKQNLSNAPPVAVKKISTITGTLEKIVPGEFTFLQVRSENGKMEKIYWMEYFEGANLLTGNIKNGRKILIQYRETEIYDSASKEYKTIKVAAGISLN